MKTTTRQDTRTHLLDTGEQLCLQRGFTGMGLNELLQQAGVPKGSFYHHFVSKEAFGVALLQRYFARSHQQFSAFLAQGDAPPQQRILAFYQQIEQRFHESGDIYGCLSVKISAEVCDLSESMRDALTQGSQAAMATLAATLEQAVAQHGLTLESSPQACAETLYLLWLGASLQSKITRDVAPMSNALRVFTHLLSPSTF